MKTDLIKEQGTNEPIVIPDECGDTMWDAVLEQEVKACNVKELSKNAASFANSIDAVQECDARKAR